LEVDSKDEIVKKEEAVDENPAKNSVSLPNNDSFKN
jgi:hypothetical protein